MNLSREQPGVFSGKNAAADNRHRKANIAEWIELYRVPGG